MEIHETRELPEDQVVQLYSECGWSAASKPAALLRALAGSDAVVSAWHDDRLIGLGNAISDGALVVYYPHLLILPSYQRAGIGRMIMTRLEERYREFHQQVVLSVLDAAPFYEGLGFVRARSANALWIYEDTDHQGESAV